MYDVTSLLSCLCLDFLSKLGLILFSLSLHFQYYTDPVNGYIFRSLKDIDRYLLSGKLGKHVTKNKLKNIDSTNERLDFAQPTVSICIIIKDLFVITRVSLRAFNPQTTPKRGIRALEWCIAISFSFDYENV